MIQRRTAIAIGVTTALSVSFAGCATGTGETSGPAEISFMAPIYSGTTTAYWEDLVEAFEKENPDIKVNLEPVSWNDVTQEITTRISAGDPPDILNFGSFVGFAADDLILPVEDYLPQEVIDDFVPSLRENGSADGVFYGTPMISSVRAMFYNQDLFDQAGIDAPPATWDELVEDAKAIKATGAAAGYGIGFGPLEPYADMAQFIWNGGGGWKTGDEWTIDSAENEEAVQFLYDLVNVEKVAQPTFVSDDRDQVWTQFGQGSIGIVQGAAFLPSLLKSQDSDVKYGIAPMPTKTGVSPSALGVQDYLVVFSATKHPEAAGAFLSYFFEPDNYYRFLTNEGMLPTTESTITEMTSADPDQVPFLELLQAARFYPSDEVWPTVQTEIQNGMSSAMDGSIPIAEWLAGLQAIAKAG